MWFRSPDQSSPDQSSCSSDTGEVLTRSTRVLPSAARSVHITAQKLQDPDAPQPDRATKENIEPRRSLPAAECRPDRKLRAGTRPPVTSDLLTSRCVSGGRELFLAALSRRAAHRREVTVQLLNSSSHNATESSVDVAPRIKSHQALRMVTGHAPVTSDLTASAPRLQEPSAGVHSNQQPSRAASVTVETGPVAIATHHHDRWPEQSSQAVVRRTNETLRETKLLLPPGDSLKTSGPDHHHSQLSQSPQSRTQSHQSRSQSHQFRTQSHQSRSQSHQSRTQSHQSRSQSHQSRSQSHQFRTQSQQTDSQKSQSHQSPFQSTQSQPCETRFQVRQSVRSEPVQRRPVLSSTLEEAGLVLRQVRRQKKVLEENLEALLRAQTGEVLHCQLDALAANRDLTEEIRIKKTVDAWISTLTRDIQAEMSSEEAAMTSQQRAAAMTSQQRAAGNSAPTGRWRSAGSEPAVGRGSRAPLQGAEPDSAAGESYLACLYGRAPYEGLRRTLKKSPYLRFSSPAAPPSRKPRPRLVESVTGVKVKSRKTQTSPGRPQRHDIIGSSHLTSGDPAGLVVTPVAMAIPLGRPRTNSSGRCLAERRQEVTLTPVAPPTCSVVAVDNGAPELQSQEEKLDAPPPPSPLPLPLFPPLPPVDIIERKSEEEEDVFPGTEFLSVADVVQEPQSLEAEQQLQLDGGASPPAVPYQGPVFPPQTRSALPTQDQASVLGLNLQRDVLEDRLVEWVEQQLMSRMISEMYRLPPPDPAQNDSTDQSASEEQRATSDIVEAAGGGGLQLFVDSNMSVDSAVIRELVTEVLTEQVALLLGQRDSLEPEPGPAEPGPQPAEPVPEQAEPRPQATEPGPKPAEPALEPEEPGLELAEPGVEPAEPGPQPAEPGLDPAEPGVEPAEPGPQPTEPGPESAEPGLEPVEQGPRPAERGPGSTQEDKPVSLVPTPVPTPPPSTETPPLATPPPSDPTSLLNDESLQPITAPEPVATPTSSPQPAPCAGSPPAVHEAPDPLTWGDAELPLDEERPEEHLDPRSQRQLMSVAGEEPPFSSPSPAGPGSGPDLGPGSVSGPGSGPGPGPGSGPEPRPASPEASISSTGTEAALKQMSEGELMLNQLAAMTEVFSFSSSLHELQEMDFDPLSEGQVKGHDLQTKKERDTQPEGFWRRDQEEEQCSVGEWRTTAAPQDQTWSPGQTSQAAVDPRQEQLNASCSFN